MKLAVLGSGSRGNALALEADGATLIVDAGFGPRTLQRRARAVGMTLEPLAGVVLTHEHGDHARGAVALARRAATPLLATPGTLARLGSADDIVRVPLVPHAPRVVPPFTVSACHIVHDAAEPVAVVIEVADGTRVGIAYDVGRPTGALRHLLRECTVLVLEANHDDVLLRTGPYPAAVRQRIAGSSGHLSNRVTAELAAALWHPGLATVVLVHVSELCNTAELARRTVAPALRRRGFQGELVVARQGEPLLVPFGQAAML
jgi:phosphoribosyl 1,2-cyclic phosphodiesterase